MKVRSKQYPNISRLLPSGTAVRFVNGLADMPDSDALSLIQDNHLYELVEDTEEMTKLRRFNGESWSKDKKLVWDGHIGYHNGYGKSSMGMIEALSDLVDIYPTASQYHGSTFEHVSPKLAALLKKQLDKLDTFYIKMQSGQNISDRIAERQIGFTMFETTAIPKLWVDNLNNNCERVLVPCKQNKEAFINSGVTRDIAVIPLGVDESYRYMKRKSEEPFVFSTMGTLTYRKGTDLVFRAFEKVFPKEKFPNVELYIKTLGVNGIGFIWFANNQELKADPRVTINGQAFSPTQLLEYFEAIDCFVFPTRGEGFGLPAIEAMATGLPTICTNWSGCADFLNDDIAYPLNYKLIETPQDPKDARGFGPLLTTAGMQWAEPDFNDLCDKMWDVYEHRAKAEEKGKKASDFILKNFTYKNSAKKLVKLLNDKF